MAIRGVVILYRNFIYGTTGNSVYIYTNVLFTVLNIF